VLNSRYWISLVVILISTIVSFNIGGYFWIGGLGILIVMAMAYLDAYNGCISNATSRWSQALFLGHIIFAFALLHVAAIMGSYTSMALLLLTWVSIINAFYVDWKRGREWQRMREMSVMAQEGFAASRPREKVDWLHEGF
jgi:hypothetical protein